MRQYRQSSLLAAALIMASGSIAGCSGMGGGRSDDGGASAAAPQRTSERPRRRASSQDLGRSRRELKAAAVEMLLELSSDLSPEIRGNSLEALQGHTGSLESVAALGLSDPNEGVRAIAAMVVGKQGLRALLPTLQGMDGETSPFVRGSVMFAMQKIQGGVDLTPLATMLLDGDDIRASSHAAYILGELGNESAVGLLQQASVREWGQVAPISRRLFRLQVAEALIKLGDRASMDAVRSALYPSRPEELEATALAVQIIGEVKDRGAIDQLIYLIDGEGDRMMPVEVRLAAAGALAKLGLPEGGFIADEYVENGNPLIRAQVATVYGRTGRAEHLGKLEGMLFDESAQVRAGSAGAILEILGM